MSEAAVTPTGAALDADRHPLCPTCMTVLMHDIGENVQMDGMF